MKFIIPSSPDILQKRDALLQSCLRPQGLPFQLTEEYPLVLKPNRQQYSFCAVSEDQVVAHANLWPRLIVDPEQQWQIPIGLVGNVATREDQRGKGIMRELFNFLDGQAKLLKLQGLILWSDLDQFYQKLGFRSLSAEYRLFFNVQALGRFCPDPTKRFFRVDPGKLNTTLIEKVSSIRFRTGCTVRRTTQEFLELLKIPSTHLYLHIENGKIVGFCIIGKGYDLVNVVHEWGCRTAEELLLGLRDIGEETEFAELMLLMPGDIPGELKNRLAAQAERIESHPMALGRMFVKDDEAAARLEKCFIWGLDSI